MKRKWPALLLLFSVGCGGGVPIQLRFDDFLFVLEADQVLGGLEERFLPPGSPAFPERWPEGFPDVCFDQLVTTDPDLGGRVDLTPASTSSDAEGIGGLLEQVNDGFIERIEIDRAIIRVERNSMNIPLPPIQLQAADEIDAEDEERRAWRTMGVVGGDDLQVPCAERAANDPLAGVQPGEVLDLDFQWARSGESFLNNQLIDENCIERQLENGGPASKESCKEFSLRARTRLTVDTMRSPNRPRGRAELRLILVATFFVSPI